MTCLASGKNLDTLYPRMVVPPFFLVYMVAVPRGLVLEVSWGRCDAALHA